MKTVFAVIVALFASVVAFAQQPTIVLSPEEVDLIEAFRANPAPFRALLRGDEAPPRENYRQYPPRPRYGDEVAGPRDAIDVAIEGGKVAFYGKRAPYVPNSVRLVRGQEAVIIFEKEGNPNTQSEKILVAYRTDGLHFDIPEAERNDRPERGLLVIRESREWDSGAPIQQTKPLSGYRSRSEADGLTFRIRYVSRR